MASVLMTAELYDIFSIDQTLKGRWLFATPSRPNVLLWLFRCTHIFKFTVSFRVSIRLKFTLDYI